MPHGKIESLRERVKRRRMEKRADRRARARRIERNEPEGVVERVQATGRQTRMLFDELTGDRDPRDRDDDSRGMAEALADVGERSNRMVSGEDHDEGELMDFGFGGQEDSNSGVEIFEGDDDEQLLEDHDNEFRI